MTPEQFCYWLQGYVEIHGNVPSEQEWLIIKDHISTVFLKLTPDRKTEPLVWEKLKQPFQSQPDPYNPPYPGTGDYPYGWFPKVTC